LINPNARVVTLREMLGDLLPRNTIIDLRLVDARCWRVRVAPLHFDSALLDLFANAGDAIRERGAGRGHVVIRTRNIRLPSRSHAGPREMVQITVADNGAGMAPATRLHACEPFFTTRGRHNAGLGLHHVASFVELAGGTLRIRSTQGRGTIVTLLLPRGTASAQRQLT
jgi:signal transduction histidine kinase